MQIFLAVILMCAGPDATDEPGVNPQAELGTTIAYGLKLLADEDYETFIQKLAHPDDLQQILKTQNIEELARSFAKEKAETIAAAFKHIKNAEPTLDETGTIAEYNLDLPDYSKKKAVFEKKGDRWFIRN